MEVLEPDKTVYETLEEAFPLATVGSLRTLAGCFGFSGDDIDKICRVLSGGEKARLVLARILYERPNFLVLDEPTNHLDIATKEMIVRSLADYDGTMLFVSHDRQFLAQLSNRVLELGPDGPTVYGGGYLEYVARSGHEAPGFGTGGSTGSGGSASGTGGSASGTGGSASGTGGSASGTGGSASGTGGSASGTGGSASGTGGTAGTPDGGGTGGVMPGDGGGTGGMVGGGEITAVRPTAGCGKAPAGTGQQTIMTMGTKPANCADTGGCGPWMYSRQYNVILPAGYVNTKAYPLVFQGPGCGGGDTGVYPLGGSSAIRVGIAPSQQAAVHHATNPGQGCFDDKEGDDSVDWPFYEACGTVWQTSSASTRTASSRPATAAARGSRTRSAASTPATPSTRSAASCRTRVACPTSRCTSRPAPTTRCPASGWASRMTRRTRSATTSSPLSAR